MCLFLFIFSLAFSLFISLKDPYHFSPPHQALYKRLSTGSFLNAMQEPVSQAHFFLAVFPGVQICIEIIMNWKPVRLMFQIKWGHCAQPHQAWRSPFLIMSIVQILETRSIQELGSGYWNTLWFVLDSTHLPYGTVVHARKCAPLRGTYILHLCWSIIAVRRTTNENVFLGMTCTDAVDVRLLG